MKAYKAYFDKQTLSLSAHDKLMALGEVPAMKKPIHWQKWGALAACCALLLGIGAYAMQSRPAPMPPVAEQTPCDSTGPSAPTPALDAPDPTEDGIVISSPAEGQSFFYFIPALNFRSTEEDGAASIAVPNDAFYVELTLSDLQTIFWGPGGKPEGSRTELDQEDLPWSLFWDGYTLHATATYDGEGELWMLYVYGRKGMDDFMLYITPGRLPPQCLREEGGETADVNGVAVASYYRAYDRNGDGLTDHICTSEFLVDGYGYRFRNVHTDDGEGEKKAAETARLFNTYFVMRAAQFADTRLYFGDVAQADRIPARRSEHYTDYAGLLAEAMFVPYLPQSGPGDMDSFEGWLTYLEGWCNTASAVWFDSESNQRAAVYVYFPERAEEHIPVDVTIPESYDMRLYPGAWYDQVPEEYRKEFRQPTFRAEDMSLAVVEARWREWSEKGSSGMLCNFKVLHGNGVLVSYELEGFTAEEVWTLIEPTL